MKKVFWRKFFLMMMVLSAVSVVEAVPNAGAPLEVAEGLLPAFGCDVLPEGGVLLADGDDVHGKEITEEDLLDPAFWKRLWGDDIDTTIYRKSDGRTAPWYKGSDNPGLPIQRVGQDNFMAGGSGEVSTDTFFTIHDKETFDEFMRACGSQITSGFTLGSTTVVKGADTISAVMTANVDLEGAKYTPVDTFKGVFNGNGYSLSNFTIESDGGKTALFANLTGTVKKLAINNATVKRSAISNDDIAVIAGRVNGGSIANCMVANSKVEGTYYMGMIAGYLQNSAKVENCLVVNGTITVVGTYSSQIGGVVGYVQSPSTLQNSVSMLDMFQLKKEKDYYPAKSTYFGRVFGGDGNNGSVVSNCYGWVETGFTTWDFDRNEYFDVYYPNWYGTNSMAYDAGTGYISGNFKHGRNIFVGDYDDAQPVKSMDENFWRSTVPFADSIWTFTAGSMYPVLKNSTDKISSNGLVARRGFEVDTKGDDLNIYTAKKFHGYHGQNIAAGDTVNLYTDIVVGKSGILWNIAILGLPGAISETNFGSLKSVAVSSYSYNYVSYFPENSGVLDGNGHKIEGLKRYYTSLASIDRVAFIAENKGVVKNLRIANMYLSLELFPNYTIFVGGICAVNNGGRIENCFMDGASFGLTAGNDKSFRIGFIAAELRNSGVVDRCIVKDIERFYVFGYSNSTNSSEGDFAGLVGVNGSGSSLTKSYVDFVGASQSYGVQGPNRVTYYGTICCGPGTSTNTYYGTSISFSFSTWVQTPIKTDIGTQSAVNTALWGSGMMDLSPDIWDIPTVDGVYPTLKKVEKEW